MLVGWEWLWSISWLAAILTVPSVLLQREGRPLAALSWLLALFALPLGTLLAWWLFGRTHLKRKRLRRRAASNEISGKLAATQHEAVTPALSGPITSLTLPAGLAGSVFPPLSGNGIDFLPSPTAAYRQWLREIDSARHHVHAAFYAWHDDEIGCHFRKQLTACARRGVEVRIMVDGVGSARLPRRFFSEFIDAGGRVEVFMKPRLLARNPMLNFRNHRKLLVIDGRIAYTGGVNIGKVFSEWEDTAIGIRGPAVNQLQEVFVDDWYFCTGEALLAPVYFNGDECENSPESTVVNTIASGPDQRWNAMREMLHLAITQCQSRLWLMTPYFIPDESLLIALRTAVYRRVQVRILVPVESDSWIVPMASRTFFSDLLHSGIELYEFPGFLHTKLALFDDNQSLIGSANLDVRSFRLNFEISTLLVSKDVTKDVENYFNGHLGKSRRIDKSSLRQRGWLGRSVDAAAHLFSPLL